MADFRDLPRIIASDKVLCNKAFNTASNPQYDGYQCGFSSMVYKFFEKNSGCGAITSNQQLADELRKPIIGNFQRLKVYSSFRDNI